MFEETVETKRQELLSSLKINTVHVQRSMIAQDHKSEGTYTLEFRLPVRELRARAGVQVSPLARLQRAGGWSFRRPLCKTADTHETVHWTVPILLDKSIVTACEPLRKQGFFSRPDHATSLEVRTDLERDVLGSWVAHDCLQLVRIQELWRLYNRAGEDSEEKKRVMSKYILHSHMYLVLWDPELLEVDNTAQHDTNFTFEVKGKLQVDIRLGQRHERSFRHFAGILTGINFDAGLSPTGLSYYECKIENTPDGYKGSIDLQSARRWYESRQTTTLGGKITVPFHPSLFVSREAFASMGDAFIEMNRSHIIQEGSDTVSKITTHTPHPKASLGPSIASTGPLRSAI
jgi:hypothetical protein